MKAKLFDRTLVGDPEQVVDFIGNILEASTEYSIIGTDLDGQVLPWNEGAQRACPLADLCRPGLS